MRRESEEGVVPLIEVYDHQDAHSLGVSALRRKARAIYLFCRKCCLDSSVPLAILGEIEISLVTDETIARVHGDFMGDPTPTDVITFDHGEILISTETAARQAPENGNTLEREIEIYVAHGFLHLAGYSDKTQADFERMRDLQARAVASAE